MPARVVLARLPPDVGSADVGDPPGDLTVERVGEILGRSPSTVRAYARDGLLPNAYRQRGREWRIPHSAITAFRKAEATSRLTSVDRQDVEHARKVGPVDLSAWRKERV